MAFNRLAFKLEDGLSLPPRLGISEYLEVFYISSLHRIVYTWSTIVIRDVSYRKLLCPSGLSLWFECGSSLLHLADPIIILSFLSLSFIRSFYYIICTIKFSNITHFYFFCSNNSKKKKQQKLSAKKGKKKIIWFLFREFQHKKKITSIQREKKKSLKGGEQTQKKKGKVFIKNIEISNDGGGWIPQEKEKKRA